MAEDEIKARFNLDTKEAIQKLVDIKGSIERIGDSNNLSGLVSGLTKVTAVAGVLGATFFALKKTLDLVFDAEQIKSVNIQFDILAKQAGIAGDKLKVGLTAAAKGLIDDEDILKSANKAILMMGKSAERLPELMEVARKASVIYGKDTKETFETLTEAVGRGNTRMLKQMGIIVDAEAAQKKYARSIDVAVNSLTEAEKSQALLNEVLTKSGKQLANVDEGALKATHTWQQLKVVIGELGDAFSLAFEKTIGPTVNKFLEWTKDKITFAKNYWEEYAQGAETASKKVNSLPLTPGSTGSSEPDPEEKEKFQKRKELELKFNNDIRQLRLEAAKVQVESSLSERAGEEAFRVEEERLLYEYMQRKLAIETNANLSKSQQIKELSELETLNTLKIQELKLRSEDIIEEAQARSYENQLKASDNFFSKIDIGLRKSSFNAGREFKKYENVGVAAAGGLANGFTDAFSHIADGNFDLARDMKKAVIGALAAEASSRGALLIASSIWPPNPLGLAAGAGLVALGGTLSALAGGDSGPRVSSPSGAAAGGATNYNPSQFGPATDNRQVLNDAEAEKARKSVSIVIQGNYFETEQTRQRLVEIIRDSADYSDFKVQSVGGGL